MFIFSTFINNAIDTSFESKVRKLSSHLHETAREIRSCDEGTALFSNAGIAVLFVIVCLVLLLLIFGMMKGILGIYCCPPVGMCGLGALIDLPRPLEYYQENDLLEFPVKYDIVGWPIHPQTAKRTVRAITMRTEFCLNVIFFLTYPVIMLISLLSYCCYHRSYDSDDADKDKQFEKTNTIMLTDCPSFKCKDKPSSKKTKPAYDGYSTEEADTKYVLEQLQKSQASLRGGSN